MFSDRFAAVWEAVQHRLVIKTHVREQITMTLKHFGNGIFIVFLFFISRLVFAADAGQQIVMQGNQSGATPCVSCHGADGAGQAAAGFPRLAGQDKNYLIMQLQAFTQGSRNNPIMAPIAGALNQQEMAEVAAYYARQTAPNPSAGKGDQSLISKGEKLALRGNWDKTIPACVTCHGPGGKGVGSHFPTLAGQNARYIEQQIEAWKSGTRHNDPNQLMQVVAKRLSQSEAKAVAAYFASLIPEK